MLRPIRVLVVDDSAVSRRILRRELQADPDIEVVGTAGNAFEARDKIHQLNPDALTLDVAMPNMNGVTFLQHLMRQYPLPVVVVSGMSTQGTQLKGNVLAAGAVGFVLKPQASQPDGLKRMIAEISQRLKHACRSTRPLIAIGASTGGVEALRTVLTALPDQMPGILIVQHMPGTFTKTFADSLNEDCALEVREAQSGDALHPGLVLVAPGGFQCRVLRTVARDIVQIGEPDRISGHSPSVDVLMHSFAEQIGKAGIGVVLTGMGSDGAAGLLALRRAGGHTIAQDKASSIVYGMPKAAWDNGGARLQLPLSRIADALQHATRP